MQLQLDENQWSRSIVLCSAIFSCQATDMTKLDNCTCLCIGIVERISYVSAITVKLTDAFTAETIMISKESRR